MRCSYYYWLGLEVQSGNGGTGQFCIFSSESVRRLDTVEVWGSSPHGSTIYLPVGTTCASFGFDGS